MNLRLVYHSIKWSIIIALVSCQEADPHPQINNVSYELSIQEERLLDSLQRQTFEYFWLGGEPTSGAARERIHLDDIYPQSDQDIVTSGGTGFGILATLGAVERRFITRDDAYGRILKLTKWLAQADRFHGAWPHWMYPDGRVKPFSRYDDGADLVETAFLAQGLIAARQFFIDGSEDEKSLAAQLDTLWREIEWSWFTRGEDVLYWHWSPNHAWKMNFAVRGYNECLIMYVLAASSPTYPVDVACYHHGWTNNGEMYNDQSRYGIPTVVNHYATNDLDVGPLFWAHYSYLGLDPRQLHDGYISYWDANMAHAQIHYRHSVMNPYDYRGYSDSCWGLTSSYSMLGYAAHNPQADLGVISPTAALSSMPYTPRESLRFMKHLYDDIPQYIGSYGPYDAFSQQSDWHVPRYLAIDQLPISVMIENFRSGFIWNLFMSAPEISEGLERLQFRSWNKPK